MENTREHGPFRYYQRTIYENYNASAAVFVSSFRRPHDTTKTQSRSNSGSYLPLHRKNLEQEGAHHDARKRQTAEIVDD